MRRIALISVLALAGACAPVMQETTLVVDNPGALLTGLSQPMVKTVVRVTEEPIGHPVAYSKSGAVCNLSGALAAKWWNIAPGTKLSCVWR